MLSVATLITAFFISPYKFNYIPEPNEIFNSYIKLISSFLYFILGYNLFKNQDITIAYKWYSYGAVMIGFIGIIIVFFNVNIFSRDYFFEGPRYIGLMSDPNYYAVIMCTSLVYFLRKRNINKILKAICYVIIFLSVAISGSKTGMIIFITYTMVILFQATISTKTKGQLIKNITILLLFVGSLPLLSNYFMKIIQGIETQHPIFKRVLVLFYDFGAAVSGDGSGRDRTWSSAIDIIKESPFGVGIGSYLNVRTSLHGGGGLAHNTYLQIISEWGVPLSLILFLFLLHLVIKHLILNNKYQVESVVVRDILLILLIGSISLSLNNARMFWFFIGALSCSNIGEKDLKSLRYATGESKKIYHTK